MKTRARSRQFAVLAVLLAFSCFGILRHRHPIGDDLSSSYVGCRLVAEGQAAHLFAHDSVLFNVEEDPGWVAAAERGSFPEDGMLHPYVQTPLWAWSLRPLCEHTSFPRFSQLFVMLFLLATSATIWLTARFWTAHLLHPAWIAVICLTLYLTEPFQYALFLVQTHVLFIFLAVAALVLARRGRPVTAGILLALAASVKITPGFLVLYWLFSRQGKAAVSFLVASAALFAATLFAVGPTVLAAYLHEIQWLSNVGLVAFNNQSLAAVWLGRHVPPSELFVWRIYPLPAALKIVGLILSLAVSMFGGVIDRADGTGAASPPGWHKPPYGAVITMLATTLVTPIAWSHYFILLLLPAMLLLDRAVEEFAARRLRPAVLWIILLTALYALNLYPVSYGGELQQFKSWSLVHSQFISCMIALAALLLLHFTFAGKKRVPAL